MAFWLFNVVPGDATPAAAHQRAVGLLRAGIWEVGADEPHRSSLSAGDPVLIYLAAPAQTFIARAELASSVQPLTPDAQGSADASRRSGVLLGKVDWWEPPVPIASVLARIDPASRAKADFDRGVVRITPDEFEAAVAAASSR